MKYELIHDSIAGQVFEKVSAEEKKRRTITNWLDNRYKQHLAQSNFLNRRDFEYIKDTLPSIRLHKDVEDFISESRRRIWIKEGLIALLITAILALLVGFLLYMNRSRQQQARLLAVNTFKEGQIIAKQNPSKGIQQMKAAQAILQEPIYEDILIEAYRNNVFGTADSLDLPMNAAAFSQNGHYLAALSSTTNNVLLYQWQQNQYSLKDSLSGIDNTSYELLFTPKDNYLFLGSTDRKAHLWEVNNWSNHLEYPKETTDEHFKINAIAFAPQKNLIAAVDDHYLRIWEQNGNQLVNTRFSKSISALCFSSNEKALYLGDKSGRLERFDLENKSTKEIHTFSEEIDQILPAPDGNYFYIQTNQLIWVGFEKEGIEEENPFIALEYPITKMQLDASGKLMLLGDTNGLIYLYRTDTGRLLNTLKGHQHPIVGLAFQEERNSIQSISSDGEIRTWEYPHHLATLSIKSDFTPHTIQVDSHFIFTTNFINGIQDYDQLGHPIDLPYQLNGEGYGAMVLNKENAYVADNLGKLNLLKWSSEGIDTLIQLTSFEQEIQTIHFIAATNQLLVSFRKTPFLQIYDLNKKLNSPINVPFKPIKTWDTHPRQAEIILQKDKQTVLRFSLAEQMTIDRFQVSGAIKNVWYSSEGNLLFLFTEEGLSQINLATKEEIRLPSTVELNKAFWIMPIENNTHYLAIARDGKVDIRDAQTGDLKRALFFDFYDLMDQFSSFSYDEIYNRLIMTTTDGEIHFWKLARQSLDKL